MSDHDGAPGETSVVDELRSQLVSTTDSLVHENQPWVLVDYPMHFNCGDSAIWLGELALAGRRRAPVARVLDRASYSPGLVPEDHTVVIQGGGNWGGLYRTHHALRLRVLGELRRHRVVQMPQSIEYVDEAAREDLRRAVNSHPDFTLLVRDERSLALARRDYDCPIHLVPDAAFAMGRLARRPAAQGRITQARTDKESPDEGPQATSTFDWLQPPPASASRTWFDVARKVNAVQRRTRHPLVARATHAATRRLARANLVRAVHLLSQGEVVVTDRLHGHVLLTLLRIPHVVVNDKFGKIEALYSTWTAPDPISRLSQSWSAADQLLEELATRP